MDFTTILNAPVEAQVVMLTVGLTHYIKSLLPEKVRKFTPILALVLGVSLMLLLKQSILMKDALAGLLLGFYTTAFYAVGKDWVKSMGEKGV